MKFAADFWYQAVFEGNTAILQKELGTNRIYVTYFRRSGRKVKEYKGKKTIAVVDGLLKKAVIAIKQYNRNNTNKIVLWSF